MPTAVIVDAIRTPLGRRNGRLKDWHPVDLAAETLKALIERTGIDPALVDDVVMGCVMQVGEQGVNIARNAVLAAGWPETVPGTTVDRQCGSSPAGGPLRRAGRDRRRLRRRGRGRRRGDDPGADGRVDGRRQVRLPLRAQGRRALRAARRPRAAGHLGRDDRRQVGHLAARSMDAFARPQPELAARATRRGPLRQPDPPRDRRRGSAHDHRRGHPRSRRSRSSPR